MSLAEALALAKQRGLDLVEISPKADPPVAKIVDFGKMLYRERKLQQKQVAHRTETKGVRISMRTGEHDLQVKVRQAEKFLKRNDRVKVTLFFRGREMTHFELGLEKIRHFAELLKGVADIDQEPKKQGRSMIMILKPKG